MVVLDTNVLSALMRRDPDPAVVAWLDRQPSESVWTTAVTVFEIRFGLEALAAGRRRRQLEDAFTRTIAEDFQGRVLPFDEDAAREAASRAAERRAAGKPVDFRDIEIAGIVSAKRATLATRNVRHFADLRIGLVDSWAKR
ncbi:MAG: type II toxin-antitoxin system VapC family toxin [Deltaproteobacteria bacterium]|nr:MAG: type II toxin-antitoxin system VapC family toxin [Deltaproteobacteria bacterium]